MGKRKRKQLARKAAQARWSKPRVVEIKLDKRPMKLRGVRRRVAAGVNAAVPKAELTNECDATACRHVTIGECLTR